VLDLLKPAFDKARGKIVVEGHTDSVGSDAFNKRLSLERAERVRAPSWRARCRPTGWKCAAWARTSRASTPETSDQDRATNRRAEILFPGETVDSLGGRADRGTGQGPGTAKEQARKPCRAPAVCGCRATG
jgi:flagellar motor protein MotB